MEPSQFTEACWGRVVRTPRGHWAFVPNPLPPPLEWTDSLVSLLSRADRALGELSGLGENLPNPHLLIYPFVRKEAVISSRIEGTQSSLSDLLLFEATKVEKQRDVREVQNYVKALEYGIKRLEELPLGLRLIRELHGILMEGVRGERATPGEFRRSQNWIGPGNCPVEEATYVPPPVSEMMEALDGLEKFLHGDPELPQLVQLALIHYQFEAIHPFIDGNGRIGRLLVSLFLCQRGILAKPLLYLSAFFERYRQEYYSRLLRVSQRGEWREWLEFFLRAVVEQCHDALARSHRLLDLHRSYYERSLERKLTPAARQLMELVFRVPVVNTRSVQASLGLTFAGARKVIEVLERENILEEVTGRKRNRAYAAGEVLRILEEDIPAR